MSLSLPMAPLIKAETLSTWEQVIHYFAVENGGLHGLVWRGHSNPNWRLQPSLSRFYEAARAFNDNEIEGTSIIPLDHYASIPKQSLSNAFLLRDDCKELCGDDEQLWAHAQHHGARTPLLDWSRGSLMALFFAMAGYAESFVVGQSNLSEDQVAVWGLFHPVMNELVEKVNQKTKSSWEFNLVESTKAGNRRVIAQQGVFTYFSGNEPLDGFVQKYSFLLPNVVDPCLIKVTIPSSIVAQGLTSLNRMGINFRTLFPDIEGACRHANLDAILPNYQGISRKHCKPIENLGTSLNVVTP